MKIRIDYLPFVLIFIVCILAIIIMSNFHPKGLAEAGMSVVDTDAVDWYIPKVPNNERPTFPEYIQEYIEKYKVYVIGKQEKILYLTFNCGYEYNGYTEDILDILQETNIKSSFFITGEYLRSNVDIVKRMIDEGHIVGNHGNTHAFLPELSRKEIEKEILDFETSYKNLLKAQYGNRYFRPASGTFSEEVLDVAHGLHYKTIFWSLAYKDWETDNQPSAQRAYDNIMDYTHDGCILMLHTVSLTNKEVLADVINDLKSQGYSFKNIDEF